MMSGGRFAFSISLLLLRNYFIISHVCFQAKDFTTDLTQLAQPAPKVSCRVKRQGVFGWQVST